MFNVIVAQNPYSSSDDSLIEPFIASIKPFTINKPKPVPRVVLVILSSSRTNLSNNVSSFFCGILSHLFLTDITALLPSTFVKNHLRVF